MNDDDADQKIRKKVNNSGKRNFNSHPTRSWLTGRGFADHHHLPLLAPLLLTFRELRLVLII